MLLLLLLLSLSSMLLLLRSGCAGCLLALGAHKTLRTILARNQSGSDNVQVQFGSHSPRGDHRSNTSGLVH